MYIFFSQLCLNVVLRIQKEAEVLKGLKGESMTNYLYFADGLTVL